MEICHRLRIDRTIASRHLAVLRNARIVTTSRNGQHICHSVNYERVHTLQCFDGTLLQV